MRRVVVTGAGGLTPLGSSWSEIGAAIEAGRSGVRSLGDWNDYAGLRATVRGAVEEGELPAGFDRRKARTLSRAAILATLASKRALESAGLDGAPELREGAAGVAYGSCLGGTDALMTLGSACAKKDLRGVPASSYVQTMSHSCAVGISLFFGLKGRIVPTCSACTSGSQAIGFAYETIRSGAQDLMLAGGAEDLCVGLVGLFDSMFATSTFSGDPAEACKPFDAKRDGVVLSEGACTLVLEELERAKARGATILAEVVGFGTNSSGTHITDPEHESMAAVMRAALRSARLGPEDIGYVHAHATATEIGDIAESRATSAVFGDRTPVGALKSYLGHTLGAAGALESWLTIEMMNEGRFAPIRNLSSPDERLSPLALLREPARIDTRHVMVNNFAFGGVNTSLVFSKP